MRNETYRDTLKAARVGRSAAPAGEPDHRGTQSIGAPAGNISSDALGERLERIRGWTGATAAQAWKLKLHVFFTGMELQALKSELGVEPGRPGKLSNGFTISGWRYPTWQDLVVSECEITRQTVHNYCHAYNNMCSAAPEVAARIIDAANPVLTGRKRRLALPDPETIIAAIPERDLEEFRAATDPWNLSDFYHREIKAAKGRQVEVAQKLQRENERHEQLEFWFGRFDRAVKQNSYLELPRPQKQVLLNQLEEVVRNLKQDLKRS